MEYYNRSVEQILADFKTSRDGLSYSQAQRRLEEYGPNRFSKGKSVTKLEIFFSQFNNPLIFILLLAFGVTAYLRDWSDLITIGAAVLINVALGFIQESKAEDSFKLLRNMLGPRATVRRSGRQMEIGADKLVPGDIVVLRSGDRVPADGRVIFETDLSLTEAALTGESFSVNKTTELLEKKDLGIGDWANCVFAGTVVTQGFGKMVVFSTGADTQMGKIAAMLTDSSFEDKTPLQKQLGSFSLQLGVLTAVICLAIFLFGWWQGHDLKEMFVTSVAIAVAAIPEGLVVGVTAILALGMRRILKKNALVRRLIAAETLGSTNFICCDKTGTLTLGEMRVTRIVNFIKGENGNVIPVVGGEIGARDSNRLSFVISTLCNQAFLESMKGREYIIRGTPTEKGLLLASLEAGFTKEDLLRDNRLLGIMPFSSERKYALSLHDRGNERIAYLAGAPEVVLEKASFIKAGYEELGLDERIRALLEKECSSLSARGLRLVALAYKTTQADDISSVGLGEGFVFVSFVCLKDPLRAETKQTLLDCQRAGLTPVIITGDNHLTALAIAQEAGLTTSSQTTLTGEVLRKMSDEELDKLVFDVSLYSRVVPQDKPRIIQSLQRRGAVVAMIGDGVNDAPAIKVANIGVSLGSGTDIAQSASDLILLGDNFRTIVDAIWEGRIIFNNIRKVVLYLLSDSFSEIILIFGALFLAGTGGSGMSLPLSASQILWINLVTDGFPHLALTAEPGDPEVMTDPPRKLSEPVANAEIKSLIFIISLFTGAACLALFLVSQRWWGYSLEHARSLVFASLGLDSLLYVFSCRNLRKPIWKTNPFNNRWLLLAVGAGLTLQIVPFFLPVLTRFLDLRALNALDWILVGGLSLLVIGLIELMKLLWMWLKKKP